MVFFRFRLAPLIIESFILAALSACGGGSSGSSGYTLNTTTLNPATVTSGATSNSTVTVTSVDGYSGEVTLACTVESAVLTAAPACSFSKPSLTLNGAASATSTLQVSSSRNTPGGAYTVSITAHDGSNLTPSNGAQSLTLTASAVIQHVVIIFQENRTPDNLFHDSVLIARGADIAISGVNS